MRTRERVSLWLAAAMAIVAGVAMMWRLKRGFDFTDEAFYLSLPLRFALGDRPFVEELNVAQTAGLLLYPFVKLHVAIRGTTGIFLFIRVLYFLFFTCVGWTAYSLASLRLPKHAALLAGAPAIAFFPYGLPGLSYNTLSCGLLSIGIFLVTHATMDPPETAPRFYADRLTWGGFALGAAAFAYPSLVVGAVLATASVFVLARGRRILSALRVALGGALFSLLVLPVFVMAGKQGLQQVLLYSGGNMNTSASKFGPLWDQFFAQHPEWTTMAVATAIAIALSRRIPRIVALALPFLPLLARGAIIGPTMTSLGYVSSLALVAPLLALALRDTRTALTLIVGAWLPSVGSGAIMSWTSSNGVIASGIGMLPAAMVSTILLALWIGELVRSFETAGIRSAFGFAPAVVLVTMVKMALADDAVYRDSTFPHLTALVTEGPYKGLLTTPERQKSLAKMSHDIIEHARTARTLFYYDFPAGYLIAARRPLVGSTWIFPIEPRTTIDAHLFEQRAKPGDVVFRVGYPTPASNPLDRAVSERCVSLGNRDGYSVWRVR